MSILNPINDVIAWVITQLYNLLSPAFGAASGVTWLLIIVLLVVLIRLILVPLFIKQMHTQRAMTALGPKMTEIRKKYKGDKERLTAETQKLYQEAGVNPLMGCLPLVLQMPIFFSLFEVLQYIADWHHGEALKYHLTSHLIISAQHAEIFGATISDKVLFTHGLDVSLQAKAVITVAVVISMVTTFLTVRQSQKRGMMPSMGDNSTMGQSQKLMSYGMPLFALTGLYWQFGLVLYWVTTNVWTLGQQFVLLRKYPVGAAAMAAGGDQPIAGKGKPGVGGAATRPALSGKPGSAGKAGSAAKPGAAGKPAKPAGSAGGTGTKPGGTPEAAAQTSENGTGPGGKGGSPGTAGGTKSAGAGKPAAKGSAGSGGKSRPAGQKPGGQKPSGSAGPGNGHKAAGTDGGLLKRLGRGRTEPEPEPAEQEAKIVRQQPQRQSRSKRTGKR